jgi:hypothetical protein
MRRTLRCFPLALTLVFLPRLLMAQHSVARAGFWWSVGVGYGSWHFSADSAARRSGDHGIGQGYLAAGFTIDRHWTMGVEGALGAIPGAGAGVSSLTVIGTWYPWRERGWFLRGGAGTSRYRESSGAEGPDYSGSGLGVLAALGVELQTTAGVSLTPQLTCRFGFVGTVGLGLPVADLARGFRQRTIGVTLGLAFP